MCILKKTAVLHKRGGVTHKIFFNFQKHWLTTMINHLSMRGSFPEESFDKTVSRCVQREAIPKKALGTETVWVKRKNFPGQSSVLCRPSPSQPCSPVTEADLLGSGYQAVWIHWPLMVLLFTGPFKLSIYLFFFFLNLSLGNLSRPTQVGCLLLYGKWGLFSEPIGGVEKPGVRTKNRADCPSFFLSLLIQKGK